MLVQMLYRTGSLKINVNDMSMNQMYKHNLLEMFGALFALKLEKELMKGLYMQYVQLEENLPVVKGNILFQNKYKIKQLVLIVYIVNTKNFLLKTN